MKNTLFIRKLISCAVAFVATCSLGVALSSCKPSNNGGESVCSMPKEDVIFDFSLKTATVVLGNEQFIPLITEIVDLSELEFTSSNESIATVVNSDGHALVQTYRPGNVTVTANLDGNTSACELTVTLGGMSPVLQFDGEKSDAYSVCVNDVFALEPYVYFNGKKYYDVESAYSGFNSAIVDKNEKGDLVAKTTGQTDVTITYTWRGMSLTYGEQKVSLQVKDRIEFVINNGKYGDEITLYTVAEHEGKTFDTQTTLDVKAYVNGVAQADLVNIELVDGDEFVRLEDTTLTSNATVGEAKIKLSSSGVTAIEKTVTVKVRKPLATYDGVLDFSTDFGVISTKTVFGRSTKIVEAYQNGRALEIVDGKILGVACSNKGGVSHELIEVYNGMVGYEVKLNACLAKISTADEFVQFFSMRMPSDFIVNGYPKDQYYTTSGYVELTQDIDLTGKEIQTYKAINGKTQYNSACAFEGVFNGKGHTVKGLKFSKGSSYGLFGNLSEAIVKNVAFTDVAFDTTTSNQALFGNGIVSQQMGVLQDVYVAITQTGNTTTSNNGGLFSGSALVGLTMKNVLVEYPDISENNVLNNGGTLFGRVDSQHPYVVKNVFIVSKTKRLGMSANQKALYKNADGELSETKDEEFKTFSHYVINDEKLHYVWVAKNDATKGADKTVTINEKEYIIPHYDLDQSMATWGTSSVSTGNALERRFVFDGISPQVHYTSNNQQYGANGEIVRFDDYTAMSEAKLTYDDFISSGCWKVTEDNILSWGAEDGVWKDDDYNPSDDNDSWSGNWTPDGETIG